MSDAELRGVLWYRDGEQSMGCEVPGVDEGPKVCVLLGDPPSEAICCVIACCIELEQLRREIFFL